MEVSHVGWAAEFRMSSTSERTISTVLVPYDEISYDTPYEEGESFAPGSLSKSLREAFGRRSLKLFRSHDHARAVGLSTSLEDRAKALVGEFRIAQTPLGDEVLSEAEQGLLDSMSIGFRAITVRRGRKGQREIAEAALMEASICPLGAYGGARVLAMRSADGSDDEEHARTVSEAARALLVPAPPAPVIDLSRPIYAPPQ